MADAAEQITVTVQFLGRDFQVNCLAEERGALLESAALLDARMQDIRRSGKVLGAERVTLMAALNLVHELLAERDQLRELEQSAQQRVDQLTGRVTDAIAAIRQLRLG
jgi:cell division protein ZapA